MERNINQTPKDFVPNGDYEYKQSVYDHYSWYETIINVNSMDNAFKDLGRAATSTIRVMEKSLNLFNNLK